jgi:hypothetical protein
MVRQLDDDERAKAERLLKRLEVKDLKMRKKWVEATANIARAWRKEGKLKPLYIVDAFGKGRDLVRGWVHFHVFFIHGVIKLLGCPAPTCRWERTCKRNYRVRRSELESETYRYGHENRVCIFLPGAPP